MTRDNILERTDLAAAREHFESACRHSRAHSEKASKALKQWGEHGALISGCVRDHFPEDVKNELRSHAQAVTRYSDFAYSARPKRVRLDTMRHLARSVATRDGSGFYGPQPYRENSK